MRSDFGIGVEGISKEMNPGNLFRTPDARGGGFGFAVNTALNPKRATVDTADAPAPAPTGHGDGARRVSGPQGT